MISAIWKLAYFANLVTKPNSVPAISNAIPSELRRHFTEACPIEKLAPLNSTRLPMVDHTVQMTNYSDND